MHAQPNKEHVVPRAAQSITLCSLGSMRTCLPALLFLLAVMMHGSIKVQDRQGLHSRSPCASWDAVDALSHSLWEWEAHMWRHGTNGSYPCGKKVLRKAAVTLFCLHAIKKNMLVYYTQQRLQDDHSYLSSKVSPSHNWSVCGELPQTGSRLFNDACPLFPLWIFSGTLNPFKTNEFLCLRNSLGKTCICLLPHFLTGTKSKQSLEVQMICSLFNIMAIYFYGLSLLLFTLNYRYIPSCSFSALQTPQCFLI